MSNENRWEYGLEVFKSVYGDVVPAPPKEGRAVVSDFGVICIEQQFAEVWSRDIMSKRDRRISVLGVLMSLGEDGAFRIHAESALANGELTGEELLEILVFLTPYVGYPRATKVKPTIEALIKRYEPGKSE